MILIRERQEGQRERNIKVRTEALRYWKVLLCGFTREDGARSQGMQAASSPYTRQRNETSPELCKDHS